MAGTLVISTLSDGTNSTSSTNCVKGSAKAWCIKNGSFSTSGGNENIIASFNITSVTKVSTGIYTANFTTPMTGYYSAVGCAIDSVSQDRCFTLQTASQATTSFTYRMGNGGGGLYDFGSSFAVFGV